MRQQCQTCSSLIEEHRHTKGEDPNQVISLLTLLGSFFSMVETPPFSLSLLNVSGGSVNLSQSLSHFSHLSLEPTMAPRSGKTGKGKSHWEVDTKITVLG